MQQTRTSGNGGGVLAWAVACTLLLGGCLATPISIPNGGDGGLPARDMGTSKQDAASRDAPRADLGPVPPPADSGPLGDAAQGDAAQGDALADAPPVDGVVIEGGAGDTTSVDAQRDDWAGGADAQPEG